MKHFVPLQGTLFLFIITRSVSNNSCVSFRWTSNVFRSISLLAILLISVWLRISSSNVLLLQRLTFWLIHRRANYAKRGDCELTLLTNRLSYIFTAQSLKSADDRYRHIFFAQRQRPRCNNFSSNNKTVPSWPACLSVGANKIDTFRNDFEKEFVERAASISSSAIDRDHSALRSPSVLEPLPESLLDRSSGSRRDEAIYMDVLSVTAARYTFVSFERSTGCFNGVLSHALEVFIRASGRLLPAQSAAWAISRRNLRDSFIRFSTREAIRVRRLCNECTNQPPFHTPSDAHSLVLLFDLSPVPAFIFPSLCTQTHTRRTSFAFRLARTVFQSPTMQTSRLRPIYISISWLDGWSRVDKSGQFSRRCDRANRVPSSVREAATNGRT